uniref:Uncharacterized protein n=1 Tax=Trichuris muris TaxID=70415 RepID=A0A5S6QLI2_TRIMR
MRITYAVLYKVNCFQKRPNGHSGDRRRSSAADNGKRNGLPVTDFVNEPSLICLNADVPGKAFAKCRSKGSSSAFRATIAFANTFAEMAADRFSVGKLTCRVVGDRLAGRKQHSTKTWVASRRKSCIARNLLRSTRKGAGRDVRAVRSRRFVAAVDVEHELRLT